MRILQENLSELKKSIDEDKITLVAVTKTHPVEKIMEIYQLGQRDMGENRVQELLEKKDHLPSDIKWHLIGHLQRNKVKYIASFVHLIHSVDSLKLLEEINKEAQKVDRVIPVLLQVYIAQEETKFGLEEQEIEVILQSEAYKSMNKINIVGLMGVATLTEDEEQIRTEFKVLHHIFNFIKTKYFSDKSSFETLSMGMSADYKIAIEEGSTLIRVGSILFGERNYKDINL